MSITATMVKELRERTGSGMMDCKRNLKEANGDIELAIENMRKAGLAKADKKAGRVAAEGMIGLKSSDDGKTVVMLEVNSETDFVIKSEDFKAFVNSITNALLDSSVENTGQLAEVVLANGESVDAARRALVAKVGENISVRRFMKYSNVNGGTACYLHHGKIATIVELTKSDVELGKDVAMHIAASNPAYVSADQVDEATIQKEKDIFTAQALKSGKKPEIVEKMISGRIKKFLAEITLQGQAFIKDDKMTVLQLTQSKDNSVVRFNRFEVGEGIEKEEVDFAKEVMEQANS
ncbi:MAG: elongation factor Ts [Methylococcales symbiont of Hymedesmia sp. n. MRB-2018]|nr:MAG: elongation factor Ts [Methylococcales symbiont of Hymedesmia sp. n. MRB-2018]KAF3984145.1 MAG: elongation factor Ts [Methylococcales symbiont of Hymedesmia sp. n. MRB-2018]